MYSNTIKVMSSKVTYDNDRMVYVAIELKGPKATIPL